MASSTRSTQRISSPAHGTNNVRPVLGTISAPVERAAQAAHMHIDRAFFYIYAMTPDHIQQLFAAENAFRTLDQNAEQPKFLRAQMNEVAVALNPHGLRIERQPVKLQNILQ